MPQNLSDVIEEKLESVAISSDGSRLFATRRDTNELLVIDTALGKQVQRTPAGKAPLDVVFQTTEKAVAYVANPNSHTISIVNPGKGVYSAPDGDSRKTDGAWDHKPDEENCGDPSREGLPDPGVDVPPVVQRTSLNSIAFTRIDALDKIWEIKCFDPHPSNGCWQSCDFIALPSD